jgi:uncharacterized protein (TIGR02996 family)
MLRQPHASFTADFRSALTCLSASQRIMILETALGDHHRGNAAMSDEQIFLQALRDRPDDDITRLVYADWLEDQDDPVARQQALFLRLECYRARTSDDSPDWPALNTRLRDLAANLSLDWTVLVSKRWLDNCPISFRFQCPKQWDQLTPTEQAPTVRHCSTCDKHVYFCGTMDEAKAHAWLVRCIAVDARVERSPDDLAIANAGLDIVGQADFLAPENIVLGEFDLDETPTPLRSWWRWLFGR